MKRSIRWEMLALLAVAVATVLYFATWTGERTEPGDAESPGIPGDTPEKSFSQVDAPFAFAPGGTGEGDCSHQAADDVAGLPGVDERAERIRRDAIRVLQQSSDPEHLLAAALLSRRDEPQLSLELLLAAGGADATHPLVASQMLELCRKPDVSCGQPLSDLERRVIQTDPGNSIRWVQVATSRLHRADEQGALEALRQAIAQSTLDENWIDYVTLFDRALAASTDLLSVERLEAAFGLTAAVASSETMIFGDCRKRSEQSAEWLDVCLRLGERFEHDGHTFLNKALGLKLQSALYEIARDSRQQELVDNRYQAFRTDHLDRLTKLSVFETQRDESVMRRYVEIFAASDEIAATDYVAAEAQRRSARTDAAAAAGCPDPG